MHETCPELEQLLLELGRWGGCRGGGSERALRGGSGQRAVARDECIRALIVLVVHLLGLFSNNLVLDGLRRRRLGVEPDHHLRLQLGVVGVQVLRVISHTQAVTATVRHCWGRRVRCCRREGIQLALRAYPAHLLEALLACLDAPRPRVRREGRCSRHLYAQTSTFEPAVCLAAGATCTLPYALWLFRTEQPFSFPTTSHSAFSLTHPLSRRRIHIDSFCVCSCGRLVLGGGGAACGLPPCAPGHRPSTFVLTCAWRAKLTFPRPSPPLPRPALLSWPVLAVSPRSSPPWCHSGKMRSATCIDVNK